MAFPSSVITDNAAAGALLTNNAATALLNVSGLQPLAQLQTIVANLLVDSPAAISIVAATIVATTITGATIRSASSSGGIGYGTGAGGIVTQGSGSGKATAFTLSKVSGQITTDAASLAAATIVSAVWTNTTIAATDVVVVNHVSGGTVGSYTFNVQCAAGSATLNIRNNTAGALAEALVLSFVVLKGVIT